MIREMTCSLPSGWKREEVIRRGGLSAGRTDVYYFSPDGRKIRSKPQLARQMGERFDLGSFDFRTGKMIQNSLLRSKRPKGTVYDHSRGIRQDASLVLPIRQTASIFKQPVTVIRNHNDGKTRPDFKYGPQDTQPRQLFWEKGLQDLRACDSNEEVIECLELPAIINGVGPGLTTANVIQSIAAALHLTNQPVVGQSSNKVAGNKNLGVTLDTSQPHMQHTIVSENDIEKQEKKVIEFRTKLKEAFSVIS